MTALAAPSRSDARVVPGSPMPSGSVERRTPEAYHLGGVEAGWLVVALAVLAGGISVWSSAVAWPWAAPVSLVLDALALGVFVSVLYLRRCPLWAQGLLLAGAAGVVALGVARAVYAAPGYGTDEAAYVQYAAALLLHGRDPYTHSMLPALSQFHVADGARTYLSSGRLVGSFSYPALGFLPLVPLLALGLHTQATIIAVTTAWVVTMVLCWALLPERSRFCAPLAGLGVLTVGYVSSGLIDPFELPFLLVAVWAWDRFCDPDSRRIRQLIGPVALGLACAVKQTPWFIAPFLILAVGLEARSRGQRVLPQLGRYLGWTAVGFGVPNLAFFLWSPPAWGRGTLLPLLSPTVAGGQGLVALLLLHGGGPLAALDVAGLLVLVVGLCALFLQYQRLRGAIVVLAACALLVPARSFGSYVAFLVPVMLVAGLSLGRPHGVRPALLSAVGRKLVLAAAVSALVAAGTVIAASLSPPPLSLTVRGTVPAGNLGLLEAVSVEVHNPTGSWLRPNFVVSSDGELGAFWPIVRGPRRVAPGSSASMTIEAPDTASMPANTAPLVVDAFVGHDVAAAHFTPAGALGLTLEPSMVAPVPVGRPVQFRVQLTDVLGAPVRQRGVRIALTQSAYGPQGPEPSEASINGDSEGNSPVAAITNRAGVALFTVRGVQAQSSPTFFQAWILRPGAALGAHSGPVAVQFDPG
jgi:hypothetical protein